MSVSVAAKLAAVVLLAMLALLPVVAGDDGSDAGNDSANSDAVELVQQGNEQLLAGDFRAASVLYQRAAELVPQRHEVYYNLGSAAFRGYDFELALEHYNRAQQSTDERLRALAKYNLGTVKYQQAIASLLTFKDAATPIQAAQGYFREALAIDPDMADARYNLELAHRMLGEIRQQRAEIAEDPEIRNQKTSENAGQMFNDASGGGEQSLSEQQGGLNTPTQGQQAKQAPPDDASTENSSRSSEAQMPQDLSPEDAEQLVQMARERASAAADERQAAQRQRMLDGAIDKPW